MGFRDLGRGVCVPWKRQATPDRFDKLWSLRDASATRLQTTINNVGSDPKMPSKSIIGDLSVKPFDYVNKASLSHRKSPDMHLIKHR